MKTTKQTTEEFVASLLPDSDKKMGTITGASLLVALALCFWAMTYEQIIDDVIFEKSGLDDLKATVSIDEKKPEKKEEKRKEVKKDKLSKRETKSTGGGKPKGTGKPNVPEARGVLKELASMTKSATASAYTLLNDQKFAKDIDKIIRNANVLRNSGKTQIGERRGKVDGGFNEGVASGNGGGIDGDLRNLFGAPGGGFNNKAMKGNMKTPSVRDIDMGSGGGSRSAADIMKVVRQRTPGLRHIYNKHLKKVPGLEGKVTLKFTIAPGGEVIAISIASSTTGHGEFDNDIKNAVGRWTFNKVKSGNTTVTIPFTFTE